MGGRGEGRGGGLSRARSEGYPAVLAPDVPTLPFVPILVQISQQTLPRSKRSLLLELRKLLLHLLLDELDNLGAERLVARLGPLRSVQPRPGDKVPAALRDRDVGRGTAVQLRDGAERSRVEE